MESEQSKKRSFIKVDKDIKYYIPCRCARAVFENLCMHRNSITGLCFPNIEDIAKEELYSDRSVKTAIKFLASLKIITIIKQWKSNGYIINDKDISYLSSEIVAPDDDSKSNLSGETIALDTLLSGATIALDTLLSGATIARDQVQPLHPNNMNSKKMNKKNNNMNISGTVSVPEGDEWIGSKNIKIGSDVILEDENNGSDVILNGSDVILEDLKLDQARSKIGSDVMHTIEYKQKNINITLESYTEEYATKDVACVCNNLNNEESMVKHEYDEKFEELWSVYPKRDTPLNKPSAFKAWKARIKDGYKAETMLKNTLNYRQRMENAGKIGTDYVKMPSTFLGPHLFFKDEDKKVAKNMGVTTNAENRRPKSRYENQIEQSTKLEKYFIDAVTAEREARISKE